jgi:DNA-binding HxlR family transcriptional regulator
MRYNNNICITFQHAAEMLSKRWTALILKVMMDGPMRFSVLAERLGVVSDRILSERLKDLERAGIITRRVFPETPVRVEYALTEKGLALGPVMDAIEHWSETWVELSAAVDAVEFNETEPEAQATAAVN